MDSHIIEDDRLFVINPFGYSNLQGYSDILINWVGVRGRLYLIKNTPNANILQLDAYQGVNRKCINVWDMNERVGISNVDLNRKSFGISYWVKIDSVRESSRSFYQLGNTNSGSRNIALHIGWRNNDTFTIAFYANDVNFSLQNQHKASNFVGKDKWVHVGLAHNASNKKSKLWINGHYYGEEQHRNGNYQSNLNLLFGKMNTTRMSGKISHLRIMVTTGNQGINWDMSDFYKLEKPHFKGVL